MSEEEKKMIPVEEATEGIKAISRRLALLHISYARVLVDELGEEKAEELIRKAIWKYGTRVGEQTRERVIEQGLEPVMDNFAKGSDLSPLGFEFRKVTVDGEPRKQTWNCEMAEVWRDYGEEKLGRLYCFVDQAKTSGYDPNSELIHTRHVLEGDECCEQAIRRLR